MPVLFGIPLIGWIQMILGGALVLFVLIKFLLRPPSGDPVPLSARELALLKMFASHPGDVLSRDFLLDSIWGVTYGGNTRTLDQHVAQLRKKLGGDAAALETVHGVGYRYAERAD